MKAGSEINIILIDGNEVELMLISEALKRLQIVYRITPFFNVDSALNYFENRMDTKPHLIIVDSDTMHLSGEYFLSKLRNNDKLRKIPLWVLTDTEGEEAFFSYLNLPAKSFIVKPAIFKRHKDSKKDFRKNDDPDFSVRFN